MNDIRIDDRGDNAKARRAAAAAADAFPVEQALRDALTKGVGAYCVEITDPVGARKDDAGKPRVALMTKGFARALLSVAEVTTFGAEKYAPDGWKYVPDGLERYADAMERHMLALKAGETHDPESGLPHRAHIAWNALALLELDQ